MSVRNHVECYRHKVSLPLKAEANIPIEMLQIELHYQCSLQLAGLIAIVELVLQLVS